MVMRYSKNKALPFGVLAFFDFVGLRCETVLGSKFGGCKGSWVKN